MNLNPLHPIAQHFRLKREESSDEGWFTWIDMKTFDHIESKSKQWLHPEEMAYYQSSLAEKRKKSFLLGRVCAKTSYLQASPQKDPSKINIRTGIFKDPVLQNQSATQWQIGITHSNTAAAALVFPATHPMAIDFEEYDTKRAKTMKTQCKPEELHSLEKIGLSNEAACAVCWTAREAVSKALRTGMTCPFELFGIESTRSHPDGGVTGLFVNFFQYQFRSWMMDGKVLTIVLPKRTHLIFSDNGPYLTNPVS
jgi:4'-phosphopantetheinyl transferase